MYPGAFFYLVFLNNPNSDDQISDPEAPPQGMTLTQVAIVFISQGWQLLTAARTVALCLAGMWLAQEVGKIHLVRGKNSAAFAVLPKMKKSSGDTKRGSPVDLLLIPF